MSMSPRAGVAVGAVLVIAFSLIRILNPWARTGKPVMIIADAGPLNELLVEWKDRADAVILTMPLDPGMARGDLPLKGAAPPLMLMTAPQWTGLEEVLETTTLDLVLLYKAEISKYVTRPWPRNNAEAFDQRFHFATAESRP